MNKEHYEILMKGVDVWNEWRKENKDIKIDLSHANLLGANLVGVDLSGADLCEADLCEANLREANLREANLRNTNFPNANLIEADLYGADLREAKFSGGYRDLFSWEDSADLIKTNLHGANLSQARLCGVDLIKADLNSANLSGANLNGADLSEANLRGADLRGADLSVTEFGGANLSGAYLGGTNLIASNLDETDFTESELDMTIFGLTDLSTSNGLDSVKVRGKCVIDFQTLQRSKLPRSFLTKIGLPEIYIDYLPSFVGSPINLFPVFLSHSWENKDFTGKLYEALIDNGVQVWYDEKKMKPGDDIYEGISKGIYTYDKMILVCSKDSLNSWWVDEELNRIFAKERKFTKEKGKKMNLLIPITIDSHVYNWEGPKSGDIKDRYVIGNFQEWQNEEKFEKALNKLITALNVDREDKNPISFL